MKKKKQKIKSTSWYVESLITSYQQDYQILAEHDAKFEKVNSLEKKEAIDSELALLDGFICNLKAILGALK